MPEFDEILCGSLYIKVYDDRLLIQSKKVVPFDDIMCIKAIPCYFRSSPYSNENDVDYFVQIILSKDKKIMLNECEHSFVDAFKKYKNISFNSVLTLDDVTQKFSKPKYIFASLLFELSPFKLALWTK